MNISINDHEIFFSVVKPIKTSAGKEDTKKGVVSRRAVYSQEDLAPIADEIVRALKDFIKRGFKI